MDDTITKADRMDNIKTLCHMIKRGFSRVTARVRHGEQGAALITALMFMLVLTMLGLAAVMTSNTEMMLSRNYRLEKVATDYANAGVQMALARLNLKSGALQLGDYATTPLTADPDFSATFNSTDGGIDLSPMSFSGTIVYRKEDNLHMRDWTGAPVEDEEVVGYSKDCNYPNSPISAVGDSFPVYVITSTGNVVSGTDTMASTTIMVEASRTPLNVNVPAPLYSEGPVTGGGTSSITSDGVLPAIYTPDTASGYAGTVSNGAINEGAASKTLEDMVGVPIEDLRAMATLPPTTTPTWNVGAVDDPQVLHINNAPGTEFVMNAGQEGWGILIVDGDLRTNGTALWHGLTIVMGNLWLNGTYNFDGSVLVMGSSNLVGSGQVGYNEAMLTDVAKSLSKSKIINWQRKYAY